MLSSFTQSRLCGLYKMMKCRTGTPLPSSLATHRSPSPLKGLDRFIEDGLGCILVISLSPFTLKVVSGTRLKGLRWDNSRFISRLRKTLLVRSHP